VREEGLFCGGSSGSNVHIALKVAKKLGRGKTVVTILPDSATRYITKFLSDAWMKDYGFLEPAADMGLVEEILKAKSHHRQVVTAREGDTVGSIIDKLKEFGVSQVPIVDPDGHPRSIVHEVDLLRGLQSGKVTTASAAKDVAHTIGGLISPKARIEELYRIFETDQVGVVVDNGKIVGIVSKIDVLEFLTREVGSRTQESRKAGKP
jgi:cystathionine beta-synthase